MEREFTCIKTGCDGMPVIYYRPQRSWGKVIFSEACVSNSVHRGACVVAQGACMVLFGGACMVLFRGCAWFYLGRHAWFYSGGMHGFIWGGMHGFIQGGMHGFFGYNEIRSMSGRYASYWNAFLLIVKLDHRRRQSDSRLRILSLSICIKVPLYFVSGQQNTLKALSWDFHLTLHSFSQIKCQEVGLLLRRKNVCAARCLTAKSRNQLNRTQLLCYGDGIENHELTCVKDICIKISCLSLREMPQKESLVNFKQSDSKTFLRNYVYRWVISSEVHQGMKIFAEGKSLTDGCDVSLCVFEGASILRLEQTRVPPQFPGPFSLEVALIIAVNSGTENGQCHSRLGNTDTLFW